MRVAPALLALALLAPVAAQAAPADVAGALRAPGRPAAYLALDAGRRPVEVLAFAGLERGDRVLDYSAGGGYYTEIIAHAVGPGGLVVGWNPPAFAARDAVRASLARIHGAAPNAHFQATATTALSFPPESFDLVLLHLAYHDAYWESPDFGFSRTDPDTVTRAIFRATRPGGVVAVIDHVAAPGRDTRAEVEATHRIDPAVVRGDWERAGFVLEAESDLLRAADDDHTRRVFDGAIRGRTDRFVYRFRKPA